MSNKLTALTSATLPLAGTEAVYLVQGGNSRQTPASSLIAGLMVLANNETVTGVKTFNNGKLALAGSTSGTTILNATATASGTLTLPAATDTLVGKATTDTFTNKTFDTAGAGNSLLISGVAASANTGTGAVVRATSPTLVTPTLGAASGTSLNLSGLTASSAVATDGSKNLVSVANTGTGNNVLATSPTLTTPTLSGVTTAGNIGSTTTAGISQSWAGATPKVGLNYNLTAASATDQEAGAIFRMTSATGSASGTGPLSAFKIPLGTEMTMNAGSGNGYAFNAVITASSGVGYQQVSGIEINQNINNQDYPFTVGQPLANFLNMGGISAFPATAYTFVNDVGSTTFGAHYGMLFYGAKTVQDSTFRDDTSSTVSVDIRGTHTYGIDMQQMTGKPMRLANNTALYWRNAANSADLSMLSVDGANNLTVGGGASGIFAGAVVVPIADNTLDLGITTSRWRHVYLSTGSTLNFNNGNYIVTHSSGKLTFSGGVLSSSPTGGVGYATGAGGTVTQITSKGTGVTLNTSCGQITMNNAALAAATIVSFAVTNSAMAATDVVVANHISGGTAGAYTINGRAAGAGSMIFDIRNNTAGSLSEAIVIQFAVIKGVNA